MNKPHSEETKRKISEGVRNNLPSTAFKKGHKFGRRFKKGEGLGNTNGFKRGQPSWNKGKKLTQEHKDKVKKNHADISGKNHYNWKGGITPLNLKIRGSIKWKIWRESIFKRDNHICQNSNCQFCNNKAGNYLHPHHIIPVKECLKLDYQDLVFDIENGVAHIVDVTVDEIKEQSYEDTPDYDIVTRIAFDNSPYFSSTFKHFDSEDVLAILYRAPFMIILVGIIGTFAGFYLALGQGGDIKSGAAVAIVSSLVGLLVSLFMDRFSFLATNSEAIILSDIISRSFKSSNLINPFNTFFSYSNLSS
ncbi:hypothetical protein LCGC14_1412110 [marine sediment metagenome]|uniref:Nuclease associated modular domain-containing protein n=1 Tax=marine sediment metagenome TaxID=412755 RepID=A0A0F9JUC0_9ZZZZ